MVHINKEGIPGYFIADLFGNYRPMFGNRFLMLSEKKSQVLLNLFIVRCKIGRL